MTTYARKIAEAVRDAAAQEANKCYIKSTSLFELGIEAAKAVQALDLDVIIAGVPAPEALKLAVGFLNLHGHESDAKKVIAEWRSEQPQATESETKFECAARRQGTAGGNDPAECDWPICGCDESDLQEVYRLLAAHNAGAQEEPVAWWHEKSETFVIVSKDKRPFADGFLPLYAAPQPSQPAASEAARDAKDAARYRWIRSRGGFLSMAFNQSPEDFDAAIDSMIERLYRAEGE